MFRALFIIFCWMPLLVLAKAEKSLHCVSGSFIDIIEQKNGQLTGLAVELTRLIGADLNLDIKIDILPFSRALQMAEQGKADCFIGAYYSKQRAQHLDYGQTPIYVDKINIISLKNDDFVWQGDYLTLQNKLLGILRSGAHGEEFDRQKDKLTTIEIGSSRQQFQMLELKRLDLILNNPRTSSNLVRKFNLKDKITIHWPAISTRPGYFAFSKKSELNKLSNKFETQMLQLKRSGKLQQLQHKYLAKYHKHSM